MDLLDRSFPVHKALHISRPEGKNRSSVVFILGDGEGKAKKREGIKKAAVDESQSGLCKNEQCLDVCVHAESGVFDGAERMPDLSEQGCASKCRLPELV